MSGLSAEAADGSSSVRAPADASDGQDEVGHVTKSV
jgi:hypothetical protein